MTFNCFIGAKCPLLPTIKNGFVVDITTDYFFGDEARVQCNKGYKLTGSNIIQCGPYQQFDNVPTCEGIDINLNIYYKTKYLLSSLRQTVSYIFFIICFQI